MNDELKKADEITRNLRECEHIGYETQRQMDLAAADLIDALQAQLVDYPHLEKVVDGQMSQNRKLRKINEALTAENAELREAQRWIPVTEKPPEGDCFVYEASKKKMHFAYAEELDAPDWLVTHWCKLPDPPQKGNNDGNKTR